MSILSDRQIAELSAMPTDVYEVAGVRKYFFHRRLGGHLVEINDFDTQVRYLPHHPKPIHELVRDVRPAELVEYRKPMIEPFVSHQVKEIHHLSSTDPNLKPGEQPVPGPMDWMEQEMKSYRWTTKIISYGLTSYGYDVRLGNKFKIFTNINSTVIDPMNMSDDCYVDFVGDVCIIPPHSYALGHTVEYFRMPKDVVAVCLGKSTYARAGCAINVTPIEPGFEGQVVIEIANQTPLPMKVYADMGIAQFMFHRGEPCMVSYADRGGKYQGQMGVTPAKV